MATDGIDRFIMQGEFQQLNFTLTNPYSSKSYEIDDEYFANTGTYDGMDGLDFLIMTTNGDYLNIVDNTTGMQVIYNIERFIANNSGDIINLAHETIQYGDVEIFGGFGDDILWANNGNDFISGSNGNDILDGGGGNDRLDAGKDNDQLFGGEGDDYLDGGEGDDVLYGGTDLGLVDLDKDFVDNITFPDLIEGVNLQNLIPPGTPALGINSDNLTVSYDATATITFREGFAGYNNTLGIYNIAEDGTINTASILWENTKTAGLDTEHSIDLPVNEGGGQFGFFIIANGDRVNDGYDDMPDITGNGVLNFIYDYGGANERAATINDDGNFISIVYDDGTNTHVLDGYHYHTTPRGEDPNLNWDGDTHAISGVLDSDNQDVLRIGFEDLPNLGDADYEDVLFDLNIDRVHIDASETGNDTLIGGAGNDVLYGEAGDDILIIGDGFDQATGGSGVDTFAFDIFDADSDTILDFEVGNGGDILNITDILSGYDAETNDINDFIQLIDNADGDTEIQIDADGTGGDFAVLAILDGGIDATLLDLINNGQLVADTSVTI